MQDSGIQKQRSSISNTRNPQTGSNINSGSRSSQFQESVDPSLLSRPSNQTLQVIGTTTNDPPVAIARTDRMFDVILILLTIVFLSGIYMIVKWYFKVKPGSHSQNSVSDEEIKTGSSTKIAEKLEEISDAVKISQKKAKTKPKSNRNKRKPKRGKRKKR